MANPRYDPRMRIACSLGIVLAVTATARADTLGYLRRTPIHGEHVLARAKGRPRVVVARTQAAWAAAWRAAGGRGPAATIDFDRQMVVGVVNGPRDDRVIYRIQLDDAARATALEVHIGTGDGPTWSGRTRPRTGAQFVITPRCDLPIHFVRDEMIDGRVYASSPTDEGVESSDIATLPAASGPAPAGKAALREHAERLAVGALTAGERAQLLRGPLDRTLARIPHGWTELDVIRGPDHWTIAYDQLVFRVDAATGAVTRSPSPRAP